MGTQGSDRRRIKTADRVFDIISFIQDSNGAGVSEIAEELGLAKSTVHEYLYTLLDRGYVIKEDDNYHVGLKFLDHSKQAKERYDLKSVVQPVLQQLADETGEVAWFVVEEHGKAIYLENARGDEAVQTHARIGNQEHLHCISAGKAMLSELPESDVHTIIDRHGLPRKTEKTITDPDTLLENLEAVRKRGYAINQEETAPRVRAIAAAIRTDNSVLGAIAISGPARRMDQKGFEEEFSDLLLGAIDEIELRLDWGTDS